jgi:hypothetical protein
MTPALMVAILTYISVYLSLYSPIPERSVTIGAILPAGRNEAAEASPFWISFRPAAMIVR